MRRELGIEIHRSTVLPKRIEMDERPKSRGERIKWFLVEIVESPHLYWQLCSKDGAIVGFNVVSRAPDSPI